MPFQNAINARICNPDKVVQKVSGKNGTAPRDLLEMSLVRVLSLFAAWEEVSAIVLAAVWVMGQDFVRKAANYGRHSSQEYFETLK